MYITSQNYYVLMMKKDFYVIYSEPSERERDTMKFTAAEMMREMKLTMVVTAVAGLPLRTEKSDLFHTTIAYE